MAKPLLKSEMPVYQQPPAPPPPLSSLPPPSSSTGVGFQAPGCLPCLLALLPGGGCLAVIVDLEDRAMHRVARGTCGESAELRTPGTLSSVGWKVVWVQVVVAGALRQAVVPVQKGVLLVHRFQVVVRLVSLGLQQAGRRAGTEGRTKLLHTD